MHLRYYLGKTALLSPSLVWHSRPLRQDSDCPTTSPRLEAGLDVTKSGKYHTPQEPPGSFILLSDGGGDTIDRSPIANWKCYSQIFYALSGYRTIMSAFDDVSGPLSPCAGNLQVHSSFGFFRLLFQQIDHRSSSPRPNHFLRTLGNHGRNSGLQHLATHLNSLVSMHLLQPQSLSASSVVRHATYIYSGMPWSSVLQRSCYLARKSGRVGTSPVYVERKPSVRDICLTVDALFGEHQSGGSGYAVQPQWWFE